MIISNFITDCMVLVVENCVVFPLKNSERKNISFLNFNHFSELIKFVSSKLLAIERIYIHINLVIVLEIVTDFKRFKKNN